MKLVSAMTSQVRVKAPSCVKVREWETVPVATTVGTG